MFHRRERITIGKSSIETVGVVMPAYNEAGILEKEVTAFISFMETLSVDFQLFVVENGSTDETSSILDDLEDTFERVTGLRQEEANFGQALKKGVHHCPHDTIFLVHVDHWDREFIRTALMDLEQYPLVQGSKNLPDSRDRRPLLRRILTGLYNTALRVLFRFDGTDTTGLKAMNKARVLPILKQCKLDREMLETELILRCQYRNLTIKERPVRLEEKRPQRDPLLEKIVTNGTDLIRLCYIFLTEKFNR
jgi:glycosyltransferase involved in cell wall biosynthesis